ncbi:DUF6389 family protein [Antarctobacter jejuensis]|uniref:DUF6389 family protein n=1 Tax=Antarctobacter jejuensis TaxID=1439938 RepID=UPI003FD4531A
MLVASVDTPDTYRDMLRLRFDQSEAAAGAALSAAVAALPDKARGLEIGVHLSQDGDGGFDIVLHAIGPDLYVLNKALEPHRTLFAGRTNAFEGTPANVPAFDSANPPFDVANVIFDEGIAWIVRLWQQFGSDSLAVPVDAFAEDGWAKVVRGPQRLHDGAP